MAEGSPASQVPGRKEQFFFTLGLVGSGAPIVEKAAAPRMSKKATSPAKSFIQQNADLNDVGTAGEVTGCPISDSIKERRDAGSPLSTLRTKVVF